MRACHRCHAKLTFCALRAGSRACSDGVYRGRLDGVDSGEHLGIAGRVCGVTGQRCGVIIGCCLISFGMALIQECGAAPAGVDGG